VTVIDASALVAYVLREERWESIESVLHESPIAVELLPVEAANATLMARRARRLNLTEAHDAVRRIHRLCEVGVRLFSPAPLLPAAWEIAERQALTVYDASYLALARRERTPLVSRDSAQIRGARELGVRVIET